MKIHDLLDEMVKNVIGSTPYDSVVIINVYSINMYVL